MVHHRINWEWYWFRFQLILTSDNHQQRGPSSVPKNPLS